MENTTNVTIKDIAKILNVSSTTVHRALHGKEGLNEELRKKIVLTAEEMGYHLNYAASSMKRKKVCFAVIFPSKDGYGARYYAYFWKGYRKYLEEVKSLNIETKEYEVDGEMDQARILKHIADAGSEAYQGVLTFSYTRHPDVMTQYYRLSAQKIPVTVLDDQLSGIDGLYCIPPFEKIIGTLCAEYFSICLPNKGTVLVCGGKLGSKVNENTIVCFRNYLNEMKPEIKLEVTAGYDDYSFEDERYWDFRERLEHIPDIVGAYSLTSITNEALVRALKETGMSQKIRVIGSDLYGQSAEHLSEGIFDVLIYKNAYEKGYFGMSMLVDCVIKHEVPQESHFCSASLIFKSCLPFYKDLIKL